MTDYFGALLRSAGAVPADALARTTPAAHADLVEQEIDVEVDAAPESGAAAQSPEAPAGIAPAPHMPTGTTPASPERHEAMRSEPVRSPVTRPVLDEVHPVVRAALEWVAADPEPVERAESEAPERQRVSDPSPRRQLPHVATQSARMARPATSADALPAAATQPVRMMRPEHTPPPPHSAHETEHDAEAARERQAAPVPPSALRELDVTLPGASRPRREGVTTIDEAALAPQDPIEVSIGTIHVRVDAPPAPRAVVQPAPPPQRPPQPARPADRSGFARSRLPRV